MLVLRALGLMWVGEAEGGIAGLGAQALSKRIHYGKFVAEAKFRAKPQEYAALIRQKDTDALMALLTDEAQEAKVLPLHFSHPETALFPEVALLLRQLVSSESQCIPSQHLMGVCVS